MWGEGGPKGDRLSTVHILWLLIFPQPSGYRQYLVPLIVRGDDRGTERAGTFPRPHSSGLGHSRAQAPNPGTCRAPTVWVCGHDRMVGSDCPPEVTPPS